MKFIRMTEDGTAGIFEIEDNDGVILIETEDGEIIYVEEELKRASEQCVKDLINRMGP